MSESTPQTSKLKKRVNRFDNLPSLAPLCSIQASNELKRYLDNEPEDIKDPIMWWYERQASYPPLSRMALDYLAIPGKCLVSPHILFPVWWGLLATSIEVEQLFSRGHLVISHVRSRLSVQGSRALMCLGVWSRLGLIKSTDIKTVSVLRWPPFSKHMDLRIWT